MNMTDLTGSSGRKALVFYFLIWGAATAYLAARGADWSFPIASLVIFGCGFSALGWFLTRRMDAPALPVVDAKRESLALLFYLALYAVVVFGWLYGLLKDAIPSGPAQEMAVLSFKVLVSVALPVAVLRLVGGKVRDMWDVGLDRKGFWLALTVLSACCFALLAVVSPALSQISELKLAPFAALFWIGGAWLWVSLEAGLPEEFLFRAGLQSRLASWMQSPMAAIIVTSLIFGLCHVPGLWLRGTPDTDGFSTNPVQVAAFTIATLSPLSIALGVLWARTRSLLLVVLVHGAIDALPFTAEFVRLWGSAF
jgi:membrane protease YdiL (CAAX protease family)